MTLIKLKKHKNHSLQVFLGLTAMAICAFFLGTNEFITIGLLPNISHSFSLTPSMAGWLTSIFTLGAGISAPIIAIITFKMTRKYVLYFLMVMLILAVIISALSTTYNILLVGRFISSLAHGSFFGIGAVVVSNMVPSNKKASAIAFMFTGLTLSNLIGVPIGTELGQNIGWRSVFWILSICSLIGCVGIAIFIPKKSVISSVNVLDELKLFKEVRFWLAFCTVSLGYSGMLASYTYVSELIVNVTGFSQSFIPWITAIYGLGAVLGNILGGKASDKFGVDTMVYVLLTLLASILFLFTFTAHYQILSIITLFFLGLIGFSLISPLMQYTITKAKAKGAETLAATANITGFGIGISLGVYLSGLALGAGFGDVSPNCVGGILTTLGLVIAIISGLKFNKSNILLK